MSRSLSTAGLFVAAACTAFAQTPDPAQTFEVATVKTSQPPAAVDGRRTMIRVGSQGGPGSADPGQMTFSFVSVRQLLVQAYSLKTYQVTGPDWLDSEHYDIVAKVAKGATKDDAKVMLQNLLKERFHLTYHMDKKEMAVYALVVGKNGPKLKESADQSDPNAAKPVAPPSDSGPSDGPPPPPPPPDPSKIKMGNDGMPVLPSRPGGISSMIRMSPNGARAKLSGNQATVGQLVDNLANQVDRPLIDSTGLTKRYDFTLDYAPDMAAMQGKMSVMMGGPMGAPSGGGAAGPGGAPASSPDAEGLPLPAAVQEQLGLKLEQKKAPVDLLVVDHVDRTATEN